MKRDLVWLFLPLLASCGEIRQPSKPRVLLDETYTSIQPLLEKRCVRCHSGSEPAGRYDLSTYLGLLGPGSDETRNVVAGDASSLLLTKLHPSSAHWAYLLPAAAELQPGEPAEWRRDQDLARLKSWVVYNKLAYFDRLVHPPGWLYAPERASAEFHGGYLRARRWDLDSCRGCHGQDLKGGSSKRSCLSCHTSGVLESCTTCHGNGDSPAPPTDLSWKLTHAAPGVGAHRIHLAARDWWAPVECKDCHKVPATVFDAGHLFDDETARTSDGRAELVFGARARLLGVTPAYDREKGTCASYCHGTAFETIGQGSRPAWTSTGTAQCGSCHKVPAVAGGPDCTTCHPRSVKLCTVGKDPACLPTGNGTGVAFLKPELHGDGKYPLGKLEQNEEACWSCHGTQASGGAPAPDLHGGTQSSLVTVGMHAAHLKETSIPHAIPCASCHEVPKAIRDKGHFDSDLPAEVVWSDLATGKARSASLDLKPTWNRSTATCSNTYCHSALDGGKVKEWKWTAGVADGIGCGSCHGEPPTKTLSGLPHPAATSCQGCHSSAYNQGKLDPTKHLNGKVDL
jgi:predicted CxxxxCH...CXXCH cytochrome family protein